jgi:SAM-dependent methyltransferase
VAKAKAKPAPVLAAVTPLKLNIGCGKSKMEGFVGVDLIKFDNVDIVADLRKRWPWEDGSVDEVHCSHFAEHLEARERVHFYNELYRVLKVGGKCTLIVPDGRSGRAYGDLTHKWPPYWAFHFFYLLKSWRTDNAPHDDARWSEGGYSCDFDATWGHSLRQDLLVRSQEYQQYAMMNYLEASQDIIATLIKRQAT